MFNRPREPIALIAILTAAVVVTGALNTSTVLRFRDTAAVAQGLDVLPGSITFDADQQLVSLSIFFWNTSSHECRIEYLRLTVTIGDRFLGTVIAGHGPRVKEPSGPEYSSPGCTVDFLTSIPLSGIHLTNYLWGLQSGAHVKASGNLTIAVPSLRARFDRQVVVTF